jgi:hypothetical protein
MATNSTIPILEFKRLLHELRDRRPDIGIRFRLMGEMWQVNHLHILEVTESGVALHDPLSGKVILITDVARIMQFEIDENFHHYEPHNHYTVDPALVNH